jgi:hypothetical protein
MKRLAAVAAVAPLLGCINVTRPLDIDLDRTELGTKVGRARIHCVTPLVCWGDAGTQAAARDGDIRILTHADHELLLILLYGRETTVVYGE